MSVEHERSALERDYPHPVERVFEAWADPTIKARWFVLGDSTGVEYASDFRVGGTETLTSPAGERPAFTYDAEYRDIVDGERIVMTYEMSIDGRRISVSVVTVEFTATSTGTHLTEVEQAVFLDGLDDAESRRGGAVRQLDALSEVLETSTES